MKRSYPVTVLVIALAASNCGAPHLYDEVDRDLTIILTDTLRIGMLPNTLTWEPYRNGMRGVEKDLLEQFGGSLDVPTEFHPVEHPDTAMKLLRTGQVDLLAGRLIASPVQVQPIAFSKPYDSTFASLCYLKEDPWYGTYRGHGNARIKHKQADPPNKAKASNIWQGGPINNMRLSIDKALTDEQLLINTALGRQNAALIDHDLALSHQVIFPHVRCQIVDSTPRPVVIGLRTKAKMLRDILDRWLAADDVQRSLRSSLKERTEHRTRRLQYAFQHPSHDEGPTISAFDHLFKRYADTARTPWKLLAALAYKESKFDTSAASYAGAVGLMQVMPRTTDLMEEGSTGSAETSIHVATRYLRKLDRIWFERVPDKQERMRFVLASYNVGLAHVLDARRLAEHHGLDPTRWEHHVERSLLLLAKPSIHHLPIVEHGYCRGYETFLFVREVISYWQHYEQL